MVGSVPKRETCSICVAWEQERSRCILVSEINLSLSLISVQGRDDGSRIEAPDSGGGEKSRNSKHSIFNRNYRIWGDCDLEEKMYRLECLGGIHQRRSRYVGRQQQILFLFCRVSQSAVGHDTLEVRKSPV